LRIAWPTFRNVTKKIAVGICSEVYYFKSRVDGQKPDLSSEKSETIVYPM